MSDELGSAAADSGAPSSGAGGSASAPPDASASSSADGIAQSDASPVGHEGPVPYQRFKEVNDKLASLRWAEAHSPETVQQQQQYFNWLEHDPEGAYNFLTDYLTRSGQLRQQAPAAPSGPQPDTRPQPDVFVPETGQRFYSADAAERLAKWQAETLLNERLSPIEEQMQDAERERVDTRAQTAAHQLLQDADTWPHFKGHEGHILNAMQRNPRLSLEGAYRQVVFPKLRELERTAIAAETRQKALAGTMNPGSTATTSRTKLSSLSMAELFKREFNRRKAG